MSTENKVRNSVRWTTFSTLTLSFLQIVQIAILARVLEPKDFGIVAIVMVILGFAQAFIDMGLSNAIIHDQNLDSTQLSTLYWLNVLAGSVIFLILNLTKLYIANFYSLPSLTEYITRISFIFLIQPFSQQFLVLLQKEMAFRELSIIELVTKLMAFFTSVILAILGYGAYSLIDSYLVATIVQTILLFYFYKNFRPRWVFNFNSVTKLTKFGFFQMLEQIVNYFNSQIDSILIGKFLGLQALGGFNITKQFVLRPASIVNPIITKVTLPLMSKIQNEEERLSELYLKTLNYLTSINAFIYLLFVVLADEFIALFLGEAWLWTATIFKLLSIYGLFRSAINPVGTLLLSKGEAKRGFFWNLGILVVFPFIIYASSFMGLEAVCIALAGTSLVLIPLMWIFLINPLIRLKFADCMVKIFSPILMSAISLLPCLYLKSFFSSNVLKILVVTLISSIVYYIMNWKLNSKFIESLHGLSGLERYLKKLNK